jgi:hypothetical protein
MNEKLFKSFSEFTYSKAADKIKDVYLNSLDDLPTFKKQHFLSRLSKVYGNHWDPLISELGSEIAKYVENLYEEYSKGKFEKSIPEFLELRKDNNANSKAKERGNDWVRENQEDCKKFLAYLDLLMKTNIVHRLKCENHFNSSKLKDIRNWLISNWEENVDFIIQNPKAFSMIPVQSINVFYYMESLKWMNPDTVDQKEKIFLEALKSEYESNLTDPINFNNYLYALTHIIIGKSWFYENKIIDYHRKYDWILQFFFDNEERIQKKSTPDIIIEIGVVLLICNEIKRVESYKKYTMNKINQYGIIPSIKSNRDDGKIPISEAEHSNILAIMLLKGF